MKNALKLFLIGSLVLCSATVSAQKFGIINSQELIAVMPELDSVEIKMGLFQKELQSQFEEIRVELNKKYEDYSAKQSTLSETVRQLKEKELQEIQGRLQQFSASAEEDIRKQQQILMAPVITRAENAIKKVSKDGGYLVVFDAAAGATVYTNEAMVTNILPMVKKELGIPESAKPKTAQ